MDAEAFRRLVGQLSGEEIRMIAAQLRAQVRDDVAWWHATLAVDRILRRSGRQRQAAMAARAAAEAAKAAAARAGLPPGDADVVAVARAAHQAVRALWALEAADCAAATLLEPWRRLASCVPADLCWRGNLVA